MNDESADTATPSDSPTRRLLAALAVALVPWTVLTIGSDVSLFFTFGILNVDPLGLTTITDFYFRYTAALPEYLTAWGLSVLVFAVGLASALVGLVWREDPRVTAAMFVFAGFGQLLFALGFLRRVGYTAIPIGTVLLWALVWRYYRRDLASIVQFPDGRE
ncbi:TIGR04206 family protein [Halorientalis halophila]|uniref:TIGR04206 family protein n=1 Tax=Halorientalis halophila TaxID=3108499 RepID=UPI00300A1CDC